MSPTGGLSVNEVRGVCNQKPSAVKKSIKRSRGRHRRHARSIRDDVTGVAVVAMRSNTVSLLGRVLCGGRALGPVRPLRRQW
jgi:hypothetical protein